MGYRSETQKKNLAWFLPRPKPDHYKGGMPLYCEEWLMELAIDILACPNPRILNVFCGMNKFGFRVDLNEEVKPDLVCDIHHLSDHLHDKFDVILADPPYSNEEQKKLYGDKFPKLSYSKWSKECTKLLDQNGLFIVYHKTLMPNPDPTIYSIAKRVFIGNRVYHVARIAVYYQKVR